MYRMHGATAWLTGVKNRRRLPLAGFITDAQSFGKGVVSSAQAQVLCDAANLSAALSDGEHAEEE